MLRRGQVSVKLLFPASTLPDFVPETKFFQDAKSLAARHLAKCHAALVSRGVKSTSSVETGNDIAGNIMEVVEREPVDMVAISTPGISGWHPLIIGSIAEKVVKLVQCPILLLHSAKPDASDEIPARHSAKRWLGKTDGRGNCFECNECCRRHTAQPDAEAGRGHRLERAHQR